MQLFLQYIGYFVVFFVAILTRGFVLTKLWEWFMTSTFNFPLISIGQAIGLCCVIGFLFPLQSVKNKQKELEKESTEEKVQKILTPIGNSLGFLLLGYIIKLFM
jgi:hypothetical protein